MKKLALIFAISLFGVACSSQAPEQREKKVSELIKKTCQVFVPDKRVAVCDVFPKYDGNEVTLIGNTTMLGVKKALRELLTEEGYVVIDSIETLPQVSLQQKTYGVVNQSVIMMRANHSYSSEAMTQALLGQPVRVLQKKGWYRIQTPDDYIGWTHRTSIVSMTKKELIKWNHADKIVITSTYAFSHRDPNGLSQRVSDLVQGNRLRYINKVGDFYQVAYPDGTQAYVARVDAVLEKDWRKANQKTADAIIKTAFTLMGVPYRWGGTSTKAMDCSGFVKTCYFLHDIILPRDASQMAYVGEKLEINKNDFSNLMPGDLLFFGRPATSKRKERVIHVALYIGNQQFIHSQGHVFVSSFNPKDANFDRYNLNRLLWATRVLNHIGEDGIQTLDKNLYYNLK